MATTTDKYGDLAERLERERNSTQDDLEGVNSDLAALSYDDAQEGAVPSNHPGDEGSDVYERERLQSVRAELATRLEQIDAARQRMADGTYGICERCGKAIPKERLDALPWATFDVQCQSEMEGAAPGNNKPFPPLTPQEGPPE